MKFRTPHAKNPPATVDQTVDQVAREAKSEDDKGAAFDELNVVTSTVDSGPAAFARTAAQSDVPAAPIEAPQEIPPALYARFEAFEFLGRGGMGAVYKARDIRLGRDVAIKLLFGTDPQLGGSLLREARAQARIVHENVCEVYEAGTVDQTRFIVMQLIRGDALDKAKASMTLEEKVRIIRQIADALHEAHRLSMVHRDVKPANIMVERGEDGAFKPYIMDFGLARDIGDSGATVSGTLMGTPSFMSPEQASGKVRSLDRRTDVYSLGATLYDVIVGHPPHKETNLAPLLQAIILDEPLSPRQINRELPLDLDAIVMRCIAKSPAARYDSAKALGEELQRFLDGEPVAALQRAQLYAFWRRVKRHKIKLTIASVALVVVTTFVGGWLRARHKAEVQANLSRELGESVKEMEFFLRNAHGLPLHNLEREHTIVRRKLMDIEATMRAAGDLGSGPGHYALGRGHFALQEAKPTIEHLRQAEAAGYRNAGLDYAMGVALTELYQKELAATKRMSGEQKKQRLAKLDAEYKKPALERLHTALGGSLETPAYAEGLIAFYEERYEDALVKARLAFEAAPWLYEAKKLEGDALFAMGRKFGHDAAFDFEKMSKWFGEANEAYQSAAEIGRSDPKVHVAQCELQTQVMCGAHAHASPMRPAFEAANAACNKGIAASPTNGPAYAAQAELHTYFASRVAGGEFPGEDPEKALDEAIKYAEEAMRKNPEDAIAHYVVAATWRARAFYDVDRGLDNGAEIEHAIAAYDEALKRDPTFLWALNESCSTHSFRAEREMQHGRSLADSVKEGLARCNKAIEIDPAFLYAKSTTLTLKLLALDEKVAGGQWPVAEINQTKAYIDVLKREAPTSTRLYFSLARIAQLATIHAFDVETDVTQALAQLETATEDFAKVAPKSTSTQQYRGDLAAFRARASFEHSEDPLPWVVRARESFDKTILAAPWDLGYRVRRASVELWAIRWALQRGNATDTHFDAARAPLLTLLDIPRDDARLYQLLGEIGELRGRFLLAEKKDASQVMIEALERIEQALALHPRLTSALTCKGRLHLMHAEQEREEPARRAEAKKALQAFEAAIRINPHIERREKRFVEKARQWAGPL